ncbi:MAG TPA: hypothetical protein V6D47_06395 [Oscillatoriaceae cyanobacterium]
MKRWLILALVLIMPLAPAFAQDARVFQDGANLFVPPPNEDPAATAAVAKALGYMRDGKKIEALGCLLELSGPSAKSPRVQILLRILTAGPATPAPTPQPTPVPADLTAALTQVQSSIKAGDYQGAMIRLQAIAPRYANAPQWQGLRDKIVASNRLSDEQLAWIAHGWQGGATPPPGIAPAPTPDPTRTRELAEAARAQQTHHALETLLADPSWGQASRQPANLQKLRALIASNADLTQPGPDGKAALPVALDNPDFPAGLIPLLSAPKPTTAIATYLKANARHPRAQALQVAGVAPLAVLESETRLDTVGTPEVTVRVLNTSRETINGYRISFHCWDANGQPVSNAGSASYLAVADSPLLPGEQTKCSWVLSGFENTDHVSYDVVYIRYQNGKVWQAP